MAAEYFKNFPELKYELDSGKIVTLKDFFRKARIESSSLENLIEYTYYELQDGERPDITASKLYGNSDLHWVFFLCNDFDNYFDWHKSNAEFETYVQNNFMGHALVASTPTDLITQTSKFLLGETVTSVSANGSVIKLEPTYNRVILRVNSGEFVSGETATGEISGKSFTPVEVKEYRDATKYYEKDGIRSTKSFSGSSEITIYDDEYVKNETKRRIKIIKPNLIRQVVSEFEKVIKR